MSLEPEKETYYSVAELSLRLGIDAKTLRSLIKENKLRAEKSKGRLRIPQTALKEFFSSSYGKPFCRRKKQREVL